MATRESRERKLAVILHADVIDSTGLVRRDETLAHRRITEAFSRFADTVAAYGGTVSEIRGDALVAEFARASDAVSSALKAQALNTEHNALLGDEICPRLRVGIALGEVVVADATVTGPGVVLAQRLEQLAEAGGVCVQSSVYEAAPERMPFDYTALGERELKGFEEPVRAYNVELRAGESPPPPDILPNAGARPGRLKQRRLTAGVVIVLATIGGILVWEQPWRSPSSGITRDATESGSSAKAGNEQAQAMSSDKASIAVLAFDNLSDDPKQDFVAEGIADDIITDLSKLSGLLVSARNSSFSYRDQDVQVKFIAEQLGVRYVLQGSLRPAGATLRINAQLVDAESGGQLWAQRFDGSSDDVLTLGDQVTREVVSSIATALTETESAELARRYTANMQAREAFVRGRAALWDGSPAGADDAIWHFEDAIELDPNFAEAYAGLAEATSRVAWRQGGTVQSDVEAAYEAATKSLSIRDTAEGRRALGAYHLWVSKEFDKASKAFRESLKLAKTAEAYALLASAELYQGRVDAAYASIDAALERARTMPTYFRSILGQIHFAAGNYEQAEAELAIALRELPPGDRGSNVAQSLCVGLHMLTSSYYLGDEEKTGKWVFQYGWFKKRTNERCAPYTDPNLHEKFHTALENAKATHFESEKRKYSKR